MRSRKIDATPLQYLQSRRDYGRESITAREIAFPFARPRRFVFVPLRVSAIFRCSLIGTAAAPGFVLEKDDSPAIPQQGYLFS
ncbi:hypothetical protein [Rhizobium mongolense]|uniref:Uncharacterized protein n=1 Tax=Rhizobium mongolense TaxID=57676 RepID=A0A7W6RRH9_9HYPH|nr:hypothetical protein [Rhizobium mongolense]MBB4277112.1 hypothetical protein [Rhizobium mongolense]